ncbi:hypothetical protein TSUD_198130 [Trifolium subterraneum]|uniref:Uncharacterized protein n=1 Tax=Trifolium subterraneum TaxID=3900 RepID=A0A2Z6M242_TRISU|nr:hypothetical protein TSUD_198130 [Trifolium subterraneum]
MAPQTNLREIGLEGFDLIDKFYGAPKRAKNNRAFPARQGRWIVQIPNDEMEEPVMNSKEVAARFGGILLVDYFKGKSHIHCGRPILN